MTAWTPNPRPGSRTGGQKATWEASLHASEIRERLERMRIRGERADQVMWLASSLHREGYILPANHAIALTGALHTAQIIMLSGTPGCGKTWLATCLNEVFSKGLPLLKVEGHEAVTLESLLYEVDETSLRLFLETAPRLPGAGESADWFGLADEARRRFIHHGPIIQSIEYGAEHHTRRVVLIDELDKFKGSSEAFLLSFLNDFSVSISHLDRYFKPKPGEEPIVIVTKNESRQIMQPTQRRCVVFPVTTPTILEEDEILCQKVPELHPLCRYFLLLLVYRIRSESLGLEKPVSISEAIDLAEAIAHLEPDGISLELVEDHVVYLAKNAADQHTLGRKIAMCYRWAEELLRPTGGDLGLAYRILMVHNEQQRDARQKREGSIRLKTSA